MKRPETRRGRLAAGLGGVVAAGVLAGGLWAAQDRDRLDLDDDAPWRTSTDPVETGGLAWATGSTVHLGDGTALDVGSDVHDFVVAGDGVFFVPEFPAEQDENLWIPPPPDQVEPPTRGPEFLFVAPGREPVPTGLPAGHDGIAVSSDGSRLALLYVGNDGSGELRFLDFSTGETYTSEEGMDTDGVDDPEWLAGEMEIKMLGYDDRVIHARVLHGDHVYDWETGEGREARDGEQPPVWGADPLESPDGRWRIEEEKRRPDRVVDRDGEEVALQVGEPRFGFTSWADAVTVVGSVVSGPGRGRRWVPGDVGTMVTCVVTSGDCTTYPETTGRVVDFETVTTDQPGLSLGGVEE